MTTSVDIDAVAQVLHNTANMTALQVAVELVRAGLPVVPTAPRQKGPLFAREHTGSCDVCRAAGFRPLPDQGETMSVDRLVNVYTAHPDAGVGVRGAGRLVFGDGDFPDAAALKAARKGIGYGQPNGVGEPCEAHTPGGQYRRRWVHYLTDGQPVPGGGDKAHGVSWYSTVGYVVVHGVHPVTGERYAPFHGDLTPLPNSVASQLRHTDRSNSEPSAPARSAEVEHFMRTHVDNDCPVVLVDIRQRVGTAQPGARHDTAKNLLVLGFRHAVAGLVSAADVRAAVRDGLKTAGWDAERFGTEYASLEAWAVGVVKDADPTATREQLGIASLSALEQHYRPDDSDNYDEPHDGTVGDDYERGSLDTDLTPGRSALTFKQLPDPYVVPAMHWLARGLWALDTHGELAGPQKALKTYLALLLAVGAAGGVPVLGHWAVERPHRVLLFVGEGGEGLFLRRLARLCEAHGVTPHMIREHLRYTVQTASLQSPTFTKGLQEQLDDFAPSLVLIDPYYSFAPPLVDGRNLYQQGSALDSVGQLVRSHGAGLLFTNHFNQTGTGVGLQRITMAGHAEWCDSWLLVNHREKPDVDRGRFRLSLDVGSRQWGGGTFDVDFDIGRYDIDTDEHVGQLRFRVQRETAAAADDTDRRKVDEAKLSLIRVWNQRRGPNRGKPWTKTEWLDATVGVGKQYQRAAFAELLDAGRIICTTGTRQNTRGSARTVELFALSDTPTPAVLTASESGADELPRRTASDTLWVVR